MALMVFFVWSQSGTAEEYYRKGAAYFERGQYKEAVAQFEAATRLAPADARAWKSLGVIHAAQGNFKPAEGPLRTACQLDPRDKDACYYLGLASYNLGQYESALDAYTKALRSTSPIGRVHSGMGLVLEALGRSADAERELREALKSGNGQSVPGFDPEVELGAFLFRQGRLEEALRILNEAAKSRPDSARAHFELARTLVQFGRLDDAASHLEKAVASDPSDAAVHLLLGRVYYRLGRDVDGDHHTRTGQTLTSRHQIPPR